MAKNSKAADRKLATGAAPTWRTGIIWLALIILILSAGLYFFKLARNYPFKNTLVHKPGFFGVTFSKKFCGEMGLDWKEVYAAVLNDLKVKEIRLPIYWDDIEPADNVFDFSDYDYIINEGAKRNVKFIANIGWRLPRWPECHAPDWATQRSLAFTEAKAVKMLAKVVEHYKNNPAVAVWQVENEPFFDAFGICPPSDENFFQLELDTVKANDSRPILISASGELSWWRQEAKLADIFGSTVYRVVWGKWGGYMRYPIPAWFYRLKAYLAGVRPANRVVIELQAEPWVPHGNIIYLPAKEANKSFNLRQFRANLQFAIDINFQKAYLWGVEWWYWQSKNGDKSYWELAKTIFD